MAEVGLAATTEDEWVEALLTLYRDRDRPTAWGATAGTSPSAPSPSPSSLPSWPRVMRRYR